MMTAVIDSDYVIIPVLVCVNYVIWLVLSSVCHFLTDNNSQQSADKDQQEMRAVAEKSHDA